jgi:50S ribosomal subunit-associated GTPase HflX
MRELLDRIDQMLPIDPLERVRFHLPPGEGAALHLLHEHAQVQSVSHSEDGCDVEAIAPESLRKRLAAFLV